jgi:uncharacterized membrane protein YfcA
MDTTGTGVFRGPSDWQTPLLVGAALAGSTAVVHGWANGAPGAGQAATIAAIVFCAALVSSVAGFAFSALAGAALAHLSIAPVEAVEAMLVCSIAIQAYAVISMRSAIEWRRLAPFLCGGVIALPLGIALLARASAAAFSLGLGVLLVLYGAYMLARKSEIVLKGNVVTDFIVGATGGITGGLAAFPGAFVTVWCGMRGWSKEAQRAVFQPYILVMQVVALALLEAWVAPPRSDHSSLVLVPIVVLAAHLGMAVFRKLSNRQFNCVVYLLLAFAGLTLVAKFA